MRQTGSVLGVAIFGSLIDRTGGVGAGARASLIISAALLLSAAVAVLASGSRENKRFSDAPEQGQRQRVSR
jgi:MFS transporter, DHA2 family, methylenomycin A resistance protein